MAVLWGWWLYQLWQPARQAELHTANVLKHVSAREWAQVGSMMASDYRDAWSHDREQALREGEEIGRNFFTLQIAPIAPVTIRPEGADISVAAVLGIYGSGTPVAYAIMEAVREAEGPFVFHWRKAGSWPWQWTLLEVAQADLAARFPR